MMVKLMERHFIISTKNLTSSYFTPLLYFLVFLIQWFFVGYFWNTRTFQTEIESEVKKHNEELKKIREEVDKKVNKDDLFLEKLKTVSYTAKNRICAIDLNNYTSTTLPIVELKNSKIDNKHSLILDTDKAYKLKTYGILTDDDLHRMASEQVTENHKQLVGIEGLKHQIVIFEQE
ncbi:MAG: hypothetical protein HY096_10815 [Nitrospinae bacterium]|nr:hypothetical protein [Nitrospinota bacterium]